MGFLSRQSLSRDFKPKYPLSLPYTSRLRGFDSYLSLGEYTTEMLHI